MHIRPTLRSDAGSRLFAGRRWLDPEEPADRAALQLGFAALAHAHPAFAARCGLPRFLQTVAAFAAAWAHQLDTAFTTAITISSPAVSSEAASADCDGPAVSAHALISWPAEGGPEAGAGQRARTSKPIRQPPATSEGPKRVPARRPRPPAATAAAALPLFKLASMSPQNIAGICHDLPPGDVRAPALAGDWTH